MEFFKKITDFIQDLDVKDFYKYIGLLFGLIFIIISFMIYSYYSQVSTYTQQIEEINDKRRDIVKRLISESKIVEIQQKEADDMLKKGTDFQIKGYFEDLLKKFNLFEYRREDGNVTEKEIDDKYRELEFAIDLDGMDMAQLCALLEELEKTKRININLLEIQKSQNKSDAIDVHLKISTLLLKTEAAV
ncbi:MAG: hypothetical protein UR12_C0004G0027 [candidate division TM6 bacterium GW2011_GWF2_30_66]|nr:MAG: hypothetical protein UR12_C0004G0027 [candidate division TM6 bacterium GW2011_GWF2_30_66]